MAEDVVYEVRCNQCQTSFSPETRRCVHCGAPLRKGRQVGVAMEDFDPHHPPEEGQLMARGPKTAIWVVMALVTAVASILRSCVE